MMMCLPPGPGKAHPLEELVRLVGAHGVAALPTSRLSAVDKEKTAAQEEP